MANQFTTYEVFQLMTAPAGWVVVMKATEGVFSQCDVACFALAKCTERECVTGRILSDEGTVVVTMIGGDGLLDIAESFDNFYGVYGPTDARPQLAESQRS